MRRQHYKAFDQRGTRVQSPIVTPGPQLRLERYSAVSGNATWHDISANGNNGTAADAAMFSDFYFDSIVDQVLTGSTEPSGDFSGNFTLTFWYKRDTTVATGFSTLMQTRRAGPNGGYILRDRDNSPAVADYTFEIVDPYQIGLPSVKGTDANWHFAALVWTLGTPNAMTSYIDGAAYATTTTANNPSAGGVLQIGRGNFYRFAGNMDTVRSYARALSADEILRDYHAGKATHP